MHVSISLTCILLVQELSLKAHFLAVVSSISGNMVMGDTISVHDNYLKDIKITISFVPMNKSTWIVEKLIKKLIIFNLKYIWISLKKKKKN